MSPGIHNLFVILQETSNDDALVDTFLHNYRNQTLQYKDLKAAVADAAVAFVLPLQARFHETRQDEAQLKTMLAEGTEKANSVAQATLNEAKELLHILALS